MHSRWEDFAVCSLACWRDVVQGACGRWVCGRLVGQHCRQCGTLTQYYRVCMQSGVCVLQGFGLCGAYLARVRGVLACRCCNRVGRGSSWRAVQVWLLVARVLILMLGAILFVTAQ